MKLSDPGSFIFASDKCFGTSSSVTAVILFKIKSFQTFTVDNDVSVVLG